MLKPLPPGEHTLHYTTGYKVSRSDPSIPPGQGNTAPYTRRDIPSYSKVNNLQIASNSKINQGITH
jgi:hypothetical protein